MKQAIDVQQFIDNLFSDPRWARHIVASRMEPQREAQYAPWPKALHQDIIEALKMLEYHQPYTHQAEAIEAALEGRDLVISTGVASGKSLCYQAPILQSQLVSSTSRALLLYPTKALAQDQVQKMQKLLLGIASKKPKLNCAIYDGDTPTETRRQIRNSARIILSNPDMLHAAILPNHSLWSSFFAGLRYVVIDEIHIYRGVFGSHFSNLIRRLKRICRVYGSNPQFICTSATLANAFQHASNILERPVKAIGKDGSPHGEHLFCIYNPPMINKELGIRRSSMVDSSALAKRWLRTRGQAILFSISRRSVEMLLLTLQGKTGNKERVRSYRSGYLPEERRRIERELRDGEIGIVISTNALELGIDIGGLDAVFLHGYPGTISATRQQAGRAGRLGGTSLCVMVASSNALDQYICQHPEFIFEQNPEQALIDPNHPEILRAHLRCAIQELTLLEDEGFGNLGSEHIHPHLLLMEEEQQIRKVAKRWIGLPDAYPAGEVSLRNIGSQLSIYHQNTCVGYIDISSSLWMTHPGAIYLEQGEMWEVTRLDLEAKKVELKPSRAHYLTQALRNSSIELLQLIRRQNYPGGTKGLGNVKVTTLITGYKKIKLISQEILGYEKLDLPPSVLDTQAWWFSLKPSLVERIRSQGLWRNDPLDYGKDWQRITQEIRARDGYRCAHCGVRENGEKFHVHHITPLRLYTSLEAANTPENLTTLCPRCHRLAEETVRIQSGLSGLAYLVVNLAPFYVMCDRKDIDVIWEERSALEAGSPTIAIYDAVPGGIGLARILYELQDRILHEAHSLVKACPCEEGCPACVGPVAENGIGAKQHTIAILEALLEEDPPA
ncbi:MAG: DEAD/DEAH box helicase [Candidatus Cloacimonetes bacterium]|nr:DEAD/DEAH box helicase [Candidatus Cloacimonadota bacterium]